MSTALLGAPAAAQRMLAGPVLPTLLRLATPNMLGLFAMTVVIGYDGVVVGRLGPDALAGVALVLPLSMLMLQMSAGGLGGATTAAVAGAVGAGQTDTASRLAAHALVLALAASLLFTGMATAPGTYQALGGTGQALGHASVYALVLFGGASVIWLVNILAAIARGLGDMMAASLALVGSTCIHLLLCPALVFGHGPLPALGVGGAAASTLLSNAAAGLGLFAWLCRRGSPLRFGPAAWRPDAAVFRGILKVGLPASVIPVLSNATVALATGFMASFGTLAVAGYGIAARLEYIVVPVAFGFGSALTAMVATNLGADQAARAKAITWTGAGLVFAITGLIGVAAALEPAAWMLLFTADPAVIDTGSRYLRIVGGCYGFFGLGLALLFASQGAGRMRWPLAASSIRLAVVAGGGWLCLQLLPGSQAALFVAIGLSFVVYGPALALAIGASTWTPAAARPARA